MGKELTTISPEGLEVANCYLQFGNIRAVVESLGVPENKVVERHEHLKHRARMNRVPIAYVNLVGGQDELIFDGGSFAVNRDGQIIAQANFFTEDLLDLVWYGSDLTGHRLENVPSSDWMLYQALVTGVRDYFKKTGFKKAVLGLSGGIDSALTLAVAADALGAENVHAVMMPYHYTADISRADAAEQAKLLGVGYEVMPIAPMVESFMDTLAESFAGTERDTTEENLQSRCRGVLLMAISNKKGLMVLTTGNKSEMAVGYATLYGDMVGGYNALKDVYKTWVYRLARWRNDQEPAIPERVIERPPSAELAPDQQDSDSLPGYDILDAILVRYIEGDMSAEAIIDAGFAREDVYQVVKLVDRCDLVCHLAAVACPDQYISKTRKVMDITLRSGLDVVELIRLTGKFLFFTSTSENNILFANLN